MPILQQKQKMKLNKIKPCFFFYSFLFALLHFSSAQNFNTQEPEEEDVKRSHFPNGFLFGTATSSYQIEGAYNEDGKSLSNWDVFAHIPGSIQDGDNGDVADDHYHQFLEDIDLMHSLGVNSYRLSISWARILPRKGEELSQGRPGTWSHVIIFHDLLNDPFNLYQIEGGGRFGELNPSGIMFYNKVIDNLVLRGIEPFVTIHHHDLPQELEDRYGAWLSPLIQEDFLHFAEICFKSFGDRVKLWATINEPNLFSDMAYIRGTYPPGHCSAPFGNCSIGNSDVEPLLVMHNLLLAHAKAVKLYRDLYQPKQGGLIGIIASTMMYEPLRDDEFDRQAAERALIFNTGWQFDPLIFGDYPQEMRRYHKNQLPRFTPEEIKYVRGSTDFIGINHYSTLYAMDCIHSSCILGGDHAIRGFVYTTGERDGVPIGEPTGMPRFFVVPRGMEKIVNFVKNRYNNMPMYVTENGYSPPAQQNEQVQDILNDVKRIEFHKAYLSSLAKAIRNGADVRGYFIWSLLDNFEWSSGYSMTFGIYYVDRQSLKRIPKLSAKWYSNFLINNSSDNEETISRGSYENKNVIVTRLNNGKGLSLY